MPRFGHMKVLTEAQIKDLVALLTDPGIASQQVEAGRRAGPFQPEVFQVHDAGEFCKALAAAAAAGFPLERALAQDLGAAPRSTIRCGRSAT
jgi:hypothetical protein